MPYKDLEKRRVSARKTYYKHREQRLKDMKLFRLKNPNYDKEYKKGNEKFLEYRRNYYYRNIEKSRARYILNNMIDSKKMIRGSCSICQLPNAEAHHTDYSKPLKVIWFCRNHHLELHRNGIIKTCLSRGVKRVAKLA